MADTDHKAESVLANLPSSFAPMPAVMRTLAQFDRPKLEGFLTVAIGLLDLIDGKPDSEDATAAEDAFKDLNADGRGCPIADPGGCEHNGREPEDDAEIQTWSHPDDHPAELFHRHAPRAAGGRMMGHELTWAELLRIYEMAKLDAADDVDSDEEIMLLGTAHSNAAWRLVTAVAPNLQALAHQLEVFREEEMFNLIDDLVRELVGAMIDNARRLSEASETKGAN